VYWQLEPLSIWLTHGLLCLPPDQHAAKAFQFFVFESPKVMMLLAIVVFGVGIIRSFFTPERTRRMLAGRRESAGNILAALLGIVTPFCSCSAVPLFIGFVEAGIPLGVTFSFLIAAPMINEVAIVLLLGLFGIRIALIYAVTGLVISIISGWIIGKLNPKKWIEPWVYQISAEKNEIVEGILAGLLKNKTIVNGLRDMVCSIVDDNDFVTQSELTDAMDDLDVQDKVEDALADSEFVDSDRVEEMIDEAIGDLEISRR